MTDNSDVACFLVTKHSWKGKYKRIFSVGTSGIRTYNPVSLEVTNYWPYDEFYSIKPSIKQGAVPGEFIINMKMKNKVDTMRFSSEFSAEILSEALRFRDRFADQTKTDGFRVNGYKQHWSGNRVAVVLEVSSAGVRQIDNWGKVLAQYNYKDIREIYKMSNYPGGFILEMGDQRRRHLFACQGVDELIQMIVRTSFDNVGVSIKVCREPLSAESFAQTRLGLCGRDDQITSFVEFTVHKVSVRHANPVRRLLCLSETCVIERDPASYAAVASRALKQVLCLVRDEKNPQQFSIEYDTGDSRTYTATERDLILASLLDGVRASGNTDAFVSTRPPERGMRLTPYRMLIDEESESQLMRQIINPPPGTKRSELLRRFNVNIPYCGLTYSLTQEGFFTENKDKLIIGCLQAVLGDTYDAQEPGGVDRVEAQLHTLHRLFASKTGFHAFTGVPGVRERLGNMVVATMKWKSEAADHAALDMLCALLQPMHSGYELRQEQLNKQSLLSSKAFLEHLLDVTVSHVERGTGALVIASMLDFLTYALCAPYSETTVGDQFDALLQLVAAKGRSFYKLFQFPCMTIVKGAGMVMRAIIEESTPEISKQMQLLSLMEGAFLKHIHLALYTDSRDVRMLTNRQLSRQLVSLWVADNDAAVELLARAVPRGLLDFLQSTDEVPVIEEEMLAIRNNLNIATVECGNKQNVVTQQLIEVQMIVERRLDALLQHWQLQQKLSFLQKKEDKMQKPVLLRKRRQRVKSSANWKMFCYQFSKDHSKPDLIWNHKTREELREALESELRALGCDKELAMATPISWNHSEFEAHYPSLADEVKIGDYYLRILLDEDERSDASTSIHKPYEFVNEVYHRFLLSAKSEMRCICLKAMAVTYGRHWESIGPFTDTRYLVAMLAKCTNAGERDHLVMLLSKLILHKENVRELITANGVPLLVDLITLAHLHVSRAHVHSQTNVIEASPDMIRDGSKEWYYSDKDGQRQGPFSFHELKTLYSDKVIWEKTQVWAQGQEGWMTVSAVPQLRWSLSATGTPLYNETQLCVLILDMFIRMCSYFPSRDEDGCVVRPVPRVKKTLSQANCLPHVVQLLLTFDPSIVERVATLLYQIMQDNPFVSRLYLTGVFFFILMYNGSNVLPIARFLHYTHMRQAFRSAVPKSELVSRSVLSPMLPEAAIYYLEQYGPEKYAEVFLGEFDNPEVIWNTEMRRQMIEKAAVHVGDFSQRMTSNVKALYQYCPIPSIAFPKLTDELFCHVYYLRHLCDLTRFPGWPIRDPVAFLRSCLAAWNDEIEKKPPSMSTEEACEVLGIKLDQASEPESVIRKAYFKLAQKYHPDKNPEGRDMFEKINAAYEFLCSTATKSAIGPDANRIVLCLKAQSIVYSRHSAELAPYKYAGYTQLIKTIRLETHDEALFSKGAPLLSAAAELCYHTLACSALNAEQLRRESGLEALQDAFDRCVSVIGRSSKPDDLAVQVCLHICKCFATAAQFESCREKISQMPAIFVNICRVLHFNHLIRLATDGSECVAAFAACTLLQTQLFQAGVLWQLLPNLFHYDYTLDEGGVDKSEDSNQQALQNRLARISCEACASLAGYRDGRPENDGVQNSLCAMLTPFVCKSMRDSPIDFVLKTLNSNSETPYMIWDNATRAEVLEFIEHHKTSRENTSELFGAEFRFSLFQKELIIGDIFVRIYNEQPNYSITEPKKFCMDLLDFLSKNAEVVRKGHQLTNGSSENSAQSTGKLLYKHIEMALEALRNVIKANPGVEMLCIGHFRLLFSYLRVQDHADLQTRALEVISLAAANQECVGDIAASCILVHLFILLDEVPSSASTVLSTLFTLASNGSVVKDALEYGGLVYTLELICCSEDGGVRVKAVETLAKMQADKLTGPRWSRLIVRYLPPIFAEAARDSPTSCVSLFDGTNENPELIWNTETRAKVQTIVRDEARALRQRQRADPSSTWKPAPDEVRAYEDVVAGELVVGGVFLRLFIANPSWGLRQPRQFATELIERTLAEMRTGSNAELLETLSTALVALLRHHPNTADQLPAQGYLPQFCQAMTSANAAVGRASILIFEQLAANTYCADGLSKLECLPGIQTAMKQRPDLLHQAAHSLSSLFSINSSALVAQALTHGLVEFLLSLLALPLAEVENSHAVKAEIVNALKAMTLNLDHGDRVSAILSKSKVWAQFKDQKHDLFLAPTPQIGAITAGAGIAGYLTQGLSYNQPREVPPPNNQ